MEFLGGLGIDVKLLVAQIINFGLLLWLLKKLLYKPIIERIERDEKELEEARKERQRLEREKTAFLEQKKKELRQVRTTAEQIINEAQEMAKKIEEKAREGAESETRSLIKLVKNRLDLQKYAVKEEIAAKIKQEVRGRFQQSLAEILSDKSQRILEDAFFNHLIQQFEKLKLDKEKDITNLMKKWEKGAKFMNAKERRRSLRNFVSARLGSVRIWCARPLGKRQEKALTRIVSKKIGFRMPIVKIEDKSIILGFRLEVAGFLIESNLWQIINYAFEINQKD
jgi:F-type H+-transporting ATPase subunit b